MPKGADKIRISYVYEKFSRFVTCLWKGKYTHSLKSGVRRFFRMNHNI